MNNIVIGWGAIDGGKNCRQLASNLKDHEPDLELLRFRRQMRQPLIRVLTFTTVEDVVHFSKLLEEKSNDISAETSVYVTGSNDKEVTLEIQEKLALKGAYVSYRTDTSIGRAVGIETIFSCGELAEQLLENKPDFKTHDYWVNRCRELIYKMRKSNNDTHSIWLKEKALDIETMIDIYSRNTHYGKPSTLTAVSDFIVEICERFEAQVSIKNLNDDEKIDLALALVD